MNFSLFYLGFSICYKTDFELSSDFIQWRTSGACRWDREVRPSLSTVGHGCPYRCGFSCSTFQLVQAIVCPSPFPVHLSVYLSVCCTSWFSLNASSGPGWCDSSLPWQGWCAGNGRSPAHSVSICLTAWLSFGETLLPLALCCSLGDLFVEFFLLQRDAEKLPGLLESCSHLINVSFNASCEWEKDALCTLA